MWPCALLPASLHGPSWACVFAPRRWLGSSTTADDVTNSGFHRSAMEPPTVPEFLNHGAAPACRLPLPARRDLRPSCRGLRRSGLLLVLGIKDQGVRPWIWLCVSWAKCRTTPSEDASMASLERRGSCAAVGACIPANRGRHRVEGKELGRACLGTGPIRRTVMKLAPWEMVVGAGVQ